MIFNELLRGATPGAWCFAHVFSPTGTIAPPLIKETTWQEVRLHPDCMKLRSFFMTESAVLAELRRARNV